MIDRSHVYDTLKNKLGGNETEVLLQYMDELVSTRTVSKEDWARLEGRIDRVPDALRHLDEKAATKADLARLEGRLGRLETTVSHLDEKMATKQQLAEVAGHLTAQIVDLSGRMAQMDLKFTEALKLSQRDLEGKFQLYFVGMAALILLTNPKAIEWFGKLMGLVK